MKVRGLKTRTNACVLVLALAFPPAAFAADMNDMGPIDPGVTMVEFGSGWYLRGDIGVSFHGPFDDIGADADDLANDVPLNGSIAIGYSFNEYFRADAEIGYVGNYSFSNSYVSGCDGFQTTTDSTGVIISQGFVTVACNSSDNGENSMWNGMVNGYVDLGNFSGFRPYVGAGIGMLYSNYSATVNDRQCEDYVLGNTTFVCTPEDQVDEELDNTSVSLLWSLNAGFAYDLTEDLAVDVGYRYLSASDASYLVEGGGAPNEATGVSVQQVRVGLRYAIW